MYSNWMYNFRCILTAVKPPTPQENNKVFQPIRGQDSASAPVRIRGGEEGDGSNLRFIYSVFQNVKKKKKKDILNMTLRLGFIMHENLFLD